MPARCPRRDAVDSPSRPARIARSNSFATFPLTNSSVTATTPLPWTGRRILPMKFACAVRAVVEENLPVATVALAYGTHRSTIHRWVARYQVAGGAEGLIRQPVSGRPRKIESIDRKALTAIVLAPAINYGYKTDFWTTRRLIQVIERLCGITVSKQTVMRRLHEAGLTYQKPEREYFELSEEERREWVRTEVPRIRRTVRKYKAIIYFQDEANISLTALLGKTWAPRGKTPKQRVTGKRGGVSAMSAITSRGQLLLTDHAPI